MYQESDKICDLMAHEEDAIQIISRFGLEMGVGDHTIAEVCTAHGVHTPTFLAIVNYKVFKQKALPADIDLETLQRYLKNAHTYFLDFRLPKIRESLIDAIRPAESSSKIPMLILRCYDEFVSEIRTHIEHENAGLFEEHAHDDERITDKLTEIKNLIIKYYPGTSYALLSVMSDLWHMELDFADHCAIEDDILRPAQVKVSGERLKVRGEKEQEELSEREGRRTKGENRKANGEQEELSERETDVLVQIVKGLSNKEIAEVLFISTHTVITHRKNISRKLNIHSTAGLTIYAIVNKLVDINSLE